jgi:hypothetical protein
MESWSRLRRPALPPPRNRRRLPRECLRIVTGEGDKVINITVGALFRHSEDCLDHRQRQGAAANLKLGHRNDLEAKVIESLDANAKVIAYPGDKIHHGVAVTVR